MLITKKNYFMKLSAVAAITYWDGDGKLPIHWTGCESNWHTFFPTNGSHAWLQNKNSLK